MPIKCTKCKETKPETEFHRDHTHPAGRKRTCRDCIALKYVKKQKALGKTVQVRRDRQGKLRGWRPKPRDRFDAFIVPSKEVPECEWHKKHYGGPFVCVKAKKTERKAFIYADTWKFSPMVFYFVPTE